VVRRLPLPAPRPVLHPLRTRETARTSVQALPGRRMRITIDHRPLAGITPQMLLWWFRHIGDVITYAGEEMSGYLAWHPLDHIRWELARPAPGGGADEGARFRIVEAFGRRAEFYVDTTETVEKLDDTGIRLVRRLLGVPIFQLEHTWAACEEGTHYVSVMDLGARSPLLVPVNRYLTTKVFPEPMAHAWVVHNIEEVGVLEHLLPEVILQRDG
jgi:hypothetical protein